MIYRISFFFAFIILFCGCSKHSKKITQSSKAILTAKLDSVGKTILDQDNIVGFSVAIMKADTLLYNKGFGFKDIDRTDSVTNQTRFLIASVSKLMGATLVMKLVEEGQLDLDQTLIELLPDFPNEAQGKKITLRQMISHTSGLPDYSTVIDSAYVKTGIPPTKADFYNFFKGRELEFEPGSNFNYSNSGFLFMGMIVERVTGNSLQEEFDRVINEPAGMGLKLIKEATNDPEMTDYFERKNDTFIPYPHWTWIKGDGGLTASSADLVKFPGKWGRGDIIRVESFNDMITPMVLTDSVVTGYGMGVRNGIIFDEKIIGHTGGHKSTYSIMVYFPETDYAFVVFMNTDNTPVSVRKIFAEFARTVFNEPFPNPEAKEILTDQLLNYTGNFNTHDYKSSSLVTVEMHDDKKLYYCFDGHCEQMTYIGNNRFWIPQWPYDYIEFDMNTQGQAVALKEFYTGYYAILRKRTP